MIRTIDVIRSSQRTSRLALVAPLAALITACGAAPDAPAGASTGGQGSADDPAMGSDGQPSSGSSGSAGAEASTGAVASDALPGTTDAGPSVESGGSLTALAVGPSLGSASAFVVLGASTVTCANLSSVTGNVGVSPGTAITGFDASAATCTIAGTIHEGDATAAQAHADLGVAYGGLGALACEHDLTGQDLGGQTLAPGVYCFATAAGLTGALTLDGGGDSAATWVFQIGSAITTGSSSSVVMSGSGNAGNVFWRVGSSATLASGTAFRGNILASASVSLVSGSSLVGRALALNAAVTSDHNAVSLP